MRGLLRRLRRALVTRTPLDSVQDCMTYIKRTYGGQESAGLRDQYSRGWRIR